MLPHIAKFSENNCVPSDSVLQDAEKQLLKPLEDLKNKEAEISRLAKALEDLEDECDALQQLIRKYKPLLSPIRRLPTDIIHEIFYRCLPTHRNAIMSITEAPLLLTRICQSWRSIALSSHRIWSKLHIPLLPYSSGPYSPYPSSSDVNTRAVWERQRESREKYARTMHARCALVDVWLSRSGLCPLSISLNFFVPTNSGLEGNMDQRDPLLRMFDLILSYSQRFSELELNLPFHVYELFEAKISLTMVPRLKKMKANLFKDVVSHIGPVPKRSVMLLQAPNLQSISIYCDTIAVLDVRIVPSTWESLTYLAVSSRINSAEAAQILRRCRNLEHCRLSIFDPVDAYNGADEIISLPRLQSLSIHVGGEDLMAFLYKRIEAPLLVSFDYLKYNRHLFNRNSDSDPAPLIPSPVLTLLEKHDNIRRLSIDPRTLSTEDLLFAFRLTNKLTHLVLGERGWLKHGAFAHYPKPGKFNLDILTTTTSGVEVPERETLLPNLEVFEAYVGTGISDADLQKFILSRLSDSSQTEVARLKTVKGTFERALEIGIDEVVRGRAKELGVEIVLDLCYIYPAMSPNKYNDLFSPWYGLSDGDRFSDYADFENFSVMAGDRFA
ncbi:hypothetical protein GALMADRAFT_870860 [Galerina marginata CBS 339.88]|uniref:F-box domain-containing protein n=1 Tax=Galerina marginata (strain CBS 339.88) TaxID=685588 RepID=A0A067TL96_GALM3|nr:hypothetical protein GALMADRAFT_870860 [Galerina marginata CBS 339.88]